MPDKKPVAPGDWEELLARQLADLSQFGKFMSQGKDIINRTDMTRLKASEQFLAELMSMLEDKGALIADVGSALGNRDPAMRGVTVREIQANPIIAKKAKVVATDIEGEFNEVPGLDTVKVGKDFKFPIAEIAKTRGNPKTWVMRAANSIDLLMNEKQTSEHLSDVIAQSKGHDLFYLYNKHVLFKGEDENQFRIMGDLSPEGFSHRGRLWREKKGSFTLRTPKEDAIVSVATAFQGPGTVAAAKGDTPFPPVAASGHFTGIPTSRVDPTGTLPSGSKTKLEREKPPPMKVTSGHFSNVRTGYSRTEFARRLKTRFPKYATIPDDELVSQILEQFPVYRSQVLE